MLKVEGLSKSFGQITAVNQMMLEVAQGEIFGFVGPNGAGKTTAMKIISALLRPDEGKVWVDGIDVLKTPNLAKRKIGYVPDFFGVYDNLKVVEYLSFFADLFEIEDAKQAQLIERLLKSVQLSDKSDMLVDALSRGMKQRLCLARALIHDPILLILDEPASGMDPVARFQFKEILQALQESGKTILLSSHILSEVSQICTTVGIMNKGEMIYKGSISEIGALASGATNVNIKLLNPSIHFVELLKEESFVKAPLLSENILGFQYEGEESGIAVCVSKLAAAGAQIVQLTYAGRALEDVFREMIGGEQLEV